MQSAGLDDAFVAKLDAAGSHQWTKRFGDDDLHQSAYAITTDADANVFVGGSFTGTIDFGGGPMTGTSTSRDGFVVKLGP